MVLDDSCPSPDLSRFHVGQQVRALDSISGQWLMASINAIHSPFVAEIIWPSNAIRVTQISVKDSLCCRRYPENWPIQPKEIPSNLQPTLKPRNEALLFSDQTLNYIKAGRGRNDLVSNCNCDSVTTHSSPFSPFPP